MDIGATSQEVFQIDPSERVEHVNRGKCLVLA